MLVRIRIHIRDPLILLRRRKCLHRNQTAAIAPRTSGMPTPNPTPRPTPRLLSELLSLPLPPVGVVVGDEAVVTVLVVVIEVEVDEILVLSGERLLTTNSTAGIENVWVELLQSHPPYPVQQNVSVPQAVTPFPESGTVHIARLPPAEAVACAVLALAAALRWVAVLRARNARYILVAVAVVALGYHFGVDRARSAGNRTEDGKSVDREMLWSTGDCLKNKNKKPKKSRSEAKGRLSVGLCGARNQSPTNRNIASWRLQASPNRTSGLLRVTEVTPYDYTAPCQGLKATLVLHRASLKSATQDSHSGYGKVKQWDLASSVISSAMRTHHKHQYPLQLYAAGSASQTLTSSPLAIKSTILLNKRSKVHRSARIQSSRHWIHRSAVYQWVIRDMIMTAAEDRLPTTRVVAAIYLAFSTDHVPATGGDIIICNTFPSPSFKYAREKKESKSKAWIMENNHLKSLRSR
ncbi:hypothetical protein BDV09DRAFT_190294 [Aspergillus tetrazonus]